MPKKKTIKTAEQREFRSSSRTMRRVGKVEVHNASSMEVVTVSKTGLKSFTSIPTQKKKNTTGASQSVVSHPSTLSSVIARSVRCATISKTVRMIGSNRIDCPVPPSKISASMSRVRIDGKKGQSSNAGSNLASSCKPRRMDQVVPSRPTAFQAATVQSHQSSSPRRTMQIDVSPLSHSDHSRVSSQLSTSPACMKIHAAVTETETNQGENKESILNLIIQKLTNLEVRLDKLKNSHSLSSQQTKCNTTSASAASVAGVGQSSLSLPAICILNNSNSETTRPQSHNSTRPS